MSFGLPVTRYGKTCYPSFPSNAFLEERNVQAVAGVVSRRLSWSDLLMRRTGFSRTQLRLAIFPLRMRFSKSEILTRHFEAEAFQEDGLVDRPVRVVPTDV